MIKAMIKIILLLLLQSTLVYAAIPEWQIVPGGSSISFTATQNGSPVSGKFKTFMGEIYFDPAQLKASHVKIIVDLNSVSASYGEVADTLKTSDWFDVKLFPQAIFKADEFTRTGDKTYQASGTLTLRDKTMPIVLTFNLEEYTESQAKISGSTTIKRTLFGVGKGEWASTDAVKDDVTVNFAINAVKR